jgi:hypothetical protein
MTEPHYEGGEPKFTIEEVRAMMFEKRVHPDRVEEVARGLGELALAKEQAAINPEEEKRA